MPSGYAELALAHTFNDAGGIWSLIRLFHVELPEYFCEMMLFSRSRLYVCQACLSHLSYVFRNGFCSASKATMCLQYHLPLHAKLYRIVQARHLSFGRALRSSNDFSEESAQGGPISKSPAYIEGIVRQTRETFGDTLPTNFLSPEEYVIYERLYGPPIQTTRPEDVRSLQELNDESVEDVEDQRSPKDVLLRENAEGGWDEVGYHIVKRQAEHDPELDQDPVEEAFDARLDPVGAEAVETKEGDTLINDHTDDFRARMTLYKDIVAANQARELDERLTEEAEAVEEDRNIEEARDEWEQEENDDQAIEDAEELSDTYGELDGGPVSRSHPITAAGKSGTKPTTIQIPKGTVLDPITALLADASKSQLKEVAQKVFGGPLLPNSTATPSSKRTHLQQQPIALEASQPHMGAMEANAYVAANIPGAYAAVMNTLEEVRKRVGPEWLMNLLKKEGGPRILDAGGGGAGALAWREILRAEWERLHPSSTVEENPVPVGKSTIVTGSATLRHRISRLLENTTFLPRLPDYNPSLNHPSLEHPNAIPRKRYDIIVAPHTLWGLKEDYMRKNQVQNLWSLLDANGGILILIEKGVPRGFELIAGAREVLLKYHIASPGSEAAENNIQEPFEGLPREKETGMIIAPCTNHLRCPLYLTHGANKGRKDFCHFSQRFHRPAFLQHILGRSSRNHEDIEFSYIAVQRGIDQRRELGIPQGQTATNAAFVGYESDTVEPSDHQDQDQSPPEENEPAQPPFVHTLSLPRVILPPLKRDNHVIIDLCTPTGTLERWTVPRSISKQPYRDARKARWGDLWALGAKVRVPRNVRLGEKKRKARGKGERELGGNEGWERDDSDFADVGEVADMDIEVGMGGRGGGRGRGRGRGRR